MTFISKEKEAKKSIFQKSKNNKGFTLVELIVVIAVIGILAGLIIVRIGSTSIDARNSIRKGHMQQIVNSIEKFKVYGGGISLKGPDCLSNGPYTLFFDAEVDAGVCLFDPTQGNSDPQLNNKYPKYWFQGGEWPHDPLSDGSYMMELLDDNNDLYQIIVDNNSAVGCPNGEACNKVHPLKN